MMLAVGEEGASNLMSLMDDDEIREISQAMANLGTIDSKVVEKLFHEFVESMSATGSLTGSMTSTEKLLGKVLPDDRVKAMMEEIRGPAGRTMGAKHAHVNEPDQNERATG